MRKYMQGFIKENPGAAIYIVFAIALAVVVFLALGRPRGDMANKHRGTVNDTASTLGEPRVCPMCRKMVLLDAHVCPSYVDFYFD